MTNKELSVRLNGKPVGVLAQTTTGKLQYQYLDYAQQALSLRMPLDKKSYGGNECETFFGGLLPENDGVRKTIGQRFGISANNTFSLLRVIGNDCAGAVSLVDMNEPITENEWHEIESKKLSDVDLAKHIKELPFRPLFIDLEGMRLSLAGAQEKAAVIAIGNDIYLPRNKCPTTHLLKPEISQYPGSVQNEYMCMRLAKKIGLAVPEVSIRKVNDIIFLLIDRYDREVVGNLVRRVHQEDFCQALGIRSSNKYQHDGGPTFKQCFELLLNTATPAASKNMLAEVLVFNLCIGNADAHGKNFSLLYPGPDIINLAPFYDLLSTFSFPNLSRDNAMKIGSTYGFAAIISKDLEKLCGNIEYGFPLLKQIFMRQAEQLPDLARQEQSMLKTAGYDHKITNDVIEVINENCARLQKRLGL